MYIHFSRVIKLNFVIVDTHIGPYILLHGFLRVDEL